MALRISGRARAAAAVFIFALALDCAPVRAQPSDYRVQGPLTFSGIPPLSPLLRRRLEHYAPWHGTRFLEWLPGGGMLVEERSPEHVRLSRLSAALVQGRSLAALARPIS